MVPCKDCSAIVAVAAEASEGSLGIRTIKRNSQEKRQLAVGGHKFGLYDHNCNSDISEKSWILSRRTKGNAKGMWIHDG